MAFLEAITTCFLRLDVPLISVLFSVLEYTFTVIPAKFNPVKYRIKITREMPSPSQAWLHSNHIRPHNRVWIEFRTPSENDYRPSEMFYYTFVVVGSCKFFSKEEIHEKTDFDFRKLKQTDNNNNNNEHSTDKDLGESFTISRDIDSKTRSFKNENGKINSIRCDDYKTLGHKKDHEERLTQKKWRKNSQEENYKHSFKNNNNNNNNNNNKSNKNILHLNQTYITNNDYRSKENERTWRYLLLHNSKSPSEGDDSHTDSSSTIEEEKPFLCSTCGKAFRLSSTLCRHKIIHTSQRPHKCYICTKTFNRSSTLKTHLRTHNPTKEFVCHVCGKGFHQKGNLRNHILIHTGEKPYSCKVCSKSFNKLSNLKFHMHMHTDQKPYRCRFCKVSMARRGELKQHINTYHFDEI